jgi:ABC-2 type transport system permease protein
MTILRIAAIHATVIRRQKALWFVVVPLVLFAMLLATVSPAAPYDGGTADIAFYARMLALFCGIAYAAAFADFFTSTSKRGLDPLEASTPTAPVLLRSTRILGAFAMILLPSVVGMLAVGIGQSVSGHPFGVPWALLAVLVIVIPSGLTAMTLSAAIGAIVPTAFARIVAVLIWFWLVFSTPLIPLPTVNGTVLNVIGDYTSGGFFGADPLYEVAGPLGLPVNPATAVVSLLWQLVLIGLLTALGSWRATARTSN